MAELASLWVARSDRFEDATLEGDVGAVAVALASAVAAWSTLADGGTDDDAGWLSAGDTGAVEAIADVDVTGGALVSAPALADGETTPAT
ncbi:MAG TPA: hypothetical protein VMU37_08010 [Caulobacteraceae bacterium]|nr:hypothetical protein [Caulobacteraceae bacterium]